LTAVARAAHHQDAPKLAAALKTSSGGGALVVGHPRRRAARDPQGYYGQMLAKATAAADSAQASTGLSALILAAGRLKTVPGIEKKLRAELDKTVGVKR
jgi:hypothetical protein